MELLIIASPIPPPTPHDPVLAAIIGSLPFDASRFRPMVYVVDRETMSPVAPILSYLTYCQNNRSNSIRTIRNKANSLYEYFLYINSLGVDYRDITLRDLIDYKHRLEAYVSPKRLNRLSPGTVYSRVSCAAAFCVYHKINDIHIDVGRSNYFRSKTRRTGAEAPDCLRVKHTVRVIECISDHDLENLFTALKQLERGAGLRDWLIAAFCLSTGSRLVEGLSLTKGRVRTAESSNTHSNVAYITLDVTKGSEPRRVAVDRQLLGLIGTYIRGPRAEAVARGQGARGDRLDPNEVFVNGTHCSPHLSGKPVAARRVEETFHAVQMAVGITREVPVLEPTTGQPVAWRVTSKHTFHHLRHTFAVNAWKAYLHLPEADRWMAIQAQLGHKSRSTTSDTYLRSVTQVGAPARDRLISYFQNITDLSHET